MEPSAFLLPLMPLLATTPVPLLHASLMPMPFPIIVVTLFRKLDACCHLDVATG